MMFREMVEQQRVEFFARQSELISVMGENIQRMIECMPKIEGMNYGPPPYIVDDGEKALILIKRDGAYSRLPFDFRLSNETVNENHDALYSIPLLNFGLVRFIPANQDYDFHGASSEIATTVDDSFFPPVDKAFELYFETALSLSKVYVAEKLIEVRRPFVRLAGESNVSVADFMGSKDVLGGLFSIFEDAFVKASGRVTELATNQEEQGDEENDQE